MKLLLLDFDGVMTDGTKAYMATGKCISKSTADVDWTALKLFIVKGYQVAFISSDDFNRELCHSRGFHFYNSRGVDGKIDKLSMLPTIMKDFGILYFKDITYCGDDLTDWPIMKTIRDAGGGVFSPGNSHPFIAVQSLNLRTPGGSGFIASVFHATFGLPTEEEIMKVQY